MGWYAGLKDRLEPLVALQLASKSSIRVFVVALCSAACVSRGHAAADHFGVVDSIQMTRILDPLDPAFHPNQSHAPGGEVAVRSPNGRLYAVLVTHGDVASNSNVYDLVLYDAGSLFSTRQHRLAFRRIAKSSRPGIAKIRWLGDSRHIAFLGTARGTLEQVWIGDTKTGAVRLLTHSHQEIRDYDITPDASVWVYAAAPPTSRNTVDDMARGFTFSWPNQSFEDVLKGQYERRGDRLQEDVFVQWHGKKARKISRAPSLIFALALSPDGRTLIETAEVKSPTSEWLRYHNAFINQVVRADLSSPNNGAFSDLIQYFEVNTQTGYRKPLIDAPASPQTPPLWIDNKNVVVCCTYLPLVEPNATDAGGGNVVAINTHDGKDSIVESEQHVISGLQWISSDQELCISGPTHSYAYRKFKNAWNRINRDESVVRISVAQNISGPPEFSAMRMVDNKTLDSSIISDLNPKIRRLALAHVQTITWRANGGLKWNASLYSPPDFNPRRLYPFVVQTHGFYPHSFEPDGATTTAMAAQALANSGIIVAQLSGPEGWAPRSLLMARQWQGGVEALIDFLAARKTIDPHRVGLTGWSYTGWLVAYFLTHSKYPIGAAITADNIDYGYMQYILLANNAEFVSEADDLIYGAAFWSKPENWLKNSPGFNLRSVQTPLRIETDNDDPLYSLESFGGLKILHKPVELVVIPGGEHSLVRPWQRLTSQGGAVDWYRFWLNGQESSDPAKSEQYGRWERLCDQQVSEGGGRVTFCVPTRH